MFRIANHLIKIDFHFRKINVNDNNEVENREENQISSNLDHPVDLKGKFRNIPTVIISKYIANSSFRITKV